MEVNLKELFDLIGECRENQSNEAEIINNESIIIFEGDTPNLIAVLIGF